MPEPEVPVGRLLKAPESFLDEAAIRRIVDDARRGRRDFIYDAFVASAALMYPLSSPLAVAQSAGAVDLNIIESSNQSRALGRPVAAAGYGQPSVFEANIQRRLSPGLTQTRQASVSFTPLQSLFGTITPNGLHFERHHSGSWDVDPTKHRLIIHGSNESLLRLPRVLTMDDLMRLPSVSRTHFIECGANTGTEWGNVAVPTCQYTHGMLSCSEYTGVPLKVVLEMSDTDFKRGRFVLAEGADGSSFSRTIPMELVESGEVLLAYGQNGEMLRPENGYPLRLVVPGVQGASWVKYLRRIKVGDKPFATMDETVRYADLMPDGMLRQYTSIQECKSVVTTPSGGQVLLTHGFYNLSGLAWSGRGRIKRVDVSTDGGRNWKVARIDQTPLSKALTRFNLDWIWEGKPALIQSRAIDETGFVQPTYRQLRKIRGSHGVYHNNAIQTWLVQESGEVKNVQLS